MEICNLLKQIVPRDLLKLGFERIGRFWQVLTDWNPKFFITTRFDKLAPWIILSVVR